MYLIGTIACEIAFRSVGIMKSSGLPSGGISSLIHWIIRLFCWFIMMLVIAFGILVFKLIVSIPWFAWLILFTIPTLIYVCYKLSIKNKADGETDNNIILEERNK